MSKLKEIKKKIKGIVLENLQDVESKNTEEYISQMKGILYFIGKSVLGVHINKNIENEESYLKYIEDGLIDNLPNIFISFEEQFSDKKHLKRSGKKQILRTILDIDRDILRNFSIGELYQELITSKERKYLGQVYTPYYIIKYMVKNSIKEEDIINNPYFKVIDPACGGGYFLLEVYNRIEEIFKNNYETIINEHKEIKTELDYGLHSFILKYNIWGADIDNFAVFMTVISLLIKEDLSNNINMNIYAKDILLDGQFTMIDIAQNTDIKMFDENTFNLVIGNPPYIGHKKIDNDYRKKLSKLFPDVYYDKADISYCFFKKAYELLSFNGKLVYITSRYFQEAPSAQGLRRFIRNHLTINSIVDFYGKSVFKGIGISPVIIQCKKKIEDSINIRVVKLAKEDDIHDAVDNGFSNSNSFVVCQDILQDNGWIFINKTERKLFNKIDEVGDCRLDEICVCNQGVITGCDKAFIVEKDIVDIENIESDILKLWIKNSQVRKYRPLISTKYILYTDQIDNIKLYENTIKHILPFKNKLIGRRECKKGIREWYQLQWGRKLDVFTRPKILFPFKSCTNEFTLSYNEVCCSADVYIMSLKEDLKEDISLEFILGYLNSSIFEFYFKSVAKKLNDKLYEYYPNKLMSLKMKKCEKEQREKIEALVNDIMTHYSKFETKDYLFNKRENHDISEKIENINKCFYRLYELTDAEIEIIENRKCTIS